VPVTSHQKREIVSDRAPQFNLVAEEVEKVNPDLIVRDSGGTPVGQDKDEQQALQTLRERIPTRSSDGVARFSM
jgi:hypothetical protein